MTQAGRSNDESASRPPRHGPVDVDVRVIDSDGRPVADATVALFEPTWRTRSGEMVVGDCRAPEPPFLTVLTDLAGRCALRTERDDCFIAASKNGVGGSGDMHLQPWAQLAFGRLTLVLTRAIRVEGVVLGAAGAPVAGAQVTTQRGGYGDRAAPPPPVATDRDGHFAVGPFMPAKR